MNTKINYTLVGITLLLSLSGCADHIDVTKLSEMVPVGFWYGLWHGMILPFAWFVSLFDSDVAIYATYNNGGWYDFGFCLGASSLGGSITLRNSQ